MTFDSESPSDPLRKGFRTLESFNEKGLAPGGGYLLIPPHDVEVLTYVREGSLIHQEPSRGSGALEVGEWRCFAARAGSRHRTVNGSLTEDAHAFQCCITPDRGELKLHAEQKRFPVAERKGMLRLTASPDGKKASLRVRQDIGVYSSFLNRGHHLIHELSPGRGAWLHVVQGRIQLIDHCLRQGDGASLVDEAAVSMTAQEPSEILLFDLA